MMKKLLVTAVASSGFFVPIGQKAEPPDAQADPAWGTLLDNLHVTHELKRKGIGRNLMQEAARRLEAMVADRSFFGCWIKM